MKKYKIGFIGYGNMAQSIVKSLANKDVIKSLPPLIRCKFDLCVSDPDDAKLMCAPKGVTTTKSNNELVAKSDYVVIAVKPQSAEKALSGLDFTGKVVLSIMAGTSVKKLEKLTKSNKIVRVMPNLNARIGQAASAYCTSGVSAEEERVALAILLSFGSASRVEEDQMDAFTGLCGSGPAFVFKFISAYVQNAIENGFSRSDAVEMAISTIAGSVNLISHTLSKADDDPLLIIKELVTAVCSKGGTTIEGVNYLDENEFEGIVVGAIAKATARAKEMTKANEEC